MFLWNVDGLNRTARRRISEEKIVRKIYTVFNNNV
jgi:hypothetical protein